MLQKSNCSEPGKPGKMALKWSMLENATANSGLWSTRLKQGWQEDPSACLRDRACVALQTSDRAGRSNMLSRIWHLVTEQGRTAESWLQLGLTGTDVLTARDLCTMLQKTNVYHNAAMSPKTCLDEVLALALPTYSAQATWHRKGEKKPYIYFFFFPPPLNNCLLRMLKRLSFDRLPTVP